ncbi:MAG TPA: DUF4198 domain-containing protein [Candidatus Udaeobacter sp.]|nr:DUF4198 domain-containing protein [Candidatus Udaeobacter sp.]
MPKVHPAAATRPAFLIALPLALSLTLAWCGRAGAHEFWLAPSRYIAAARDTVTLGVLVGTGFKGELKPWAAPRAVSFTMHGPRALDLRPVTLNGDVVWARVVLPDDGGALFAYESNWADITVPAPEFEAYLATEGLDQPLAARRRAGATGPGRERYARCPKCWIKGSHPERARQTIGLSLEIVPLDDPSSVRDLRVRVLFHGQPLAGALVRGWTRPLASPSAPIAASERDSVPPVASARTGRDGIARLDLAHDGEWMLSCVHMTPSDDTREADWQSLWASLTFARPGKAPTRVRR